MYTLLIVFYVLVAVALIGLVLIQQGKGADAGAAFGSGASGTVFGSRGSANFLSRATAWLATVFFLLSLALAYVVHGRSTARSVVVDTPEPAAAAPGVAAPTAEVPPPAPADGKATPSTLTPPAAAPEGSGQSATSPPAPPAPSKAPG